MTLRFRKRNRMSDESRRQLEQARDEAWRKLNERNRGKGDVLTSLRSHKRRK